jgi:hypothetical protein
MVLLRARLFLTAKPILKYPCSTTFIVAETLELEDFDLTFTLKCPKCDYLNEEVSARDMSSGNAECGMCETIFRVEGLDAVKVTATLD